MAVIAKKCPDILINVVDINENRINAWNSADLAELPIFEPGLDEVIKKCRNRNLFFTTEVKKSIESADMVFLSVNTPIKSKGIGAGFASDLKWVEASARQIAKFAKGHTIVVEKSTLPVRTASTIKEILINSCLDKDNTFDKKFSVLSNPEFLAEGTAIDDLENPDRVLIGGIDKFAIESLKNIYGRWVDREKIITMNLWSSELSKLIANAFLAQRISSMNAVAALCESTGANINEVEKAIGADSRIGNKFLKAGPGFGGSCFKKDILNIVYLSNFYGLKEVADYWNQVVLINNWTRHRISKIIVNKLFGTVSGKKLSILGFSFKANTNDTRESSAIQICNNLLEEGAELVIYDPKVSYRKIEEDLIQKEKIPINQIVSEGSWSKANTIEEAAENSDAIIVLTEWDMFKNLDWEKLSSLMRKPSWLFDTRNITDHKKASENGINIWLLGSSN